MGLFSRKRAPEPGSPVDDPSVDCTAIDAIVPREHVKLCGRVLGIRVRPTDTLPAYVARLGDDSGSITIVWTGRRSVGGVGLGKRMLVEGTPVASPDGLCIYNPVYTLLP
jgi:hypothetical protein